MDCFDLFGPNHGKKERTFSSTRPVCFAAGKKELCSKKWKVCTTLAGCSAPFLSSLGTDGRGIRRIIKLRRSLPPSLLASFLLPSFLLPCQKRKSNTSPPPARRPRRRGNGSFQCQLSIRGFHANFKLHPATERDTAEWQGGAAHPRERWIFSLGLVYLSLNVPRRSLVSKGPLPQVTKMQSPIDHFLCPDAICAPHLRFPSSERIQRFPISSSLLSPFLKARPHFPTTRHVGPVFKIRYTIRKPV